MNIPQEDSSTTVNDSNSTQDFWNASDINSTMSRNQTNIESTSNHTNKYHSNKITKADLTLTGLGTGFITLSLATMNKDNLYTAITLPIGALILTDQIYSIIYGKDNVRAFEKSIGNYLNDYKAEIIGETFSSLALTHHLAYGNGDKKISAVLLFGNALFGLSLLQGLGNATENLIINPTKTLFSHIEDIAKITTIMGCTYGTSQAMLAKNYYATSVGVGAISFSIMTLIHGFSKTIENYIKPAFKFTSTHLIEHLEIATVGVLYIDAAHKLYKQQLKAGAAEIFAASALTSFALHGNSEFVEHSYHKALDFVYNHKVELIGEAISIGATIFSLRAKSPLLTSVSLLTGGLFASLMVWGEEVTTKAISSSLDTVYSHIYGEEGVAVIGENAVNH